jgi:subtilisin-like proprotein convertase family protein
VFESLLAGYFGFGFEVRARNSAGISLTFVAFTAVVLPASGSTTLYVYGGPFNNPIPANTGSNRGLMKDAVIDVNEHLIITDLDVAIDIVHTDVFDLEIMLQGPNGVKICLNAYYDVKDFFNEPNYSQTIFDDEADLAIEQGSAPFNDSFRPKSGNFLSAFDGTDAYGQWVLRIDDLYDDDRGYLESFELRITVPEPATFMLFTLAGLLLRSRN